MREYWAREAEMMRDKSAVLGTNTEDSSTFGKNIVKTAKRIFTNKVTFGLNSIRNKIKLFDTNYWVADGESKLKMIAGKSPAKALLSIIDNTCGKQTLDCAQFVQVVYLGAILLTDGEKQFDVQMKGEFVLSSFRSTGVETETKYTRDIVNGKFAEDNNPKKPTKLTQEALIKSAPIGSLVSVENFFVEKLATGSDTEGKKFALGIRAKGWERENMIKIGEDKYAAFGVGYDVNMKTVEKGLVDEFYGKGKYNASQETSMMQWIRVSQIELFKRK